MGSPRKSNDKTTPEPPCPLCGSRMVQRTARKGPNAGNDFWGCSTYPDCRGSRDIELSIKDAKYSQTDPRPFHLRTSRASLASYTIESTQVPWEFLECLQSDDSISQGAYGRALAQWVLEVPDPGIGNAIHPSIPLAIRILQRGRFIPIPPRIQSDIVDALTFDKATNEPSGAVWDKAAKFVGNYLPTSTCGQDAFDSEDERHLLHEIIGAGALAGAGRWITPQAPFSGLTGDSSDERRVDFLVAHPDHPTWTLEVDGAQHVAARTVDRDREEHLKQFNIATHRISTHDLRQSGLAEDTRIHGLLEQICDLPGDCSTLSRECMLLLAGKRIHQIQLAALYAMMGAGENKASDRYNVAISRACQYREDDLTTSYLLDLAIADLASLLNDIGSLVGDSSPSPKVAVSTLSDDADLFICWDSRPGDNSSSKLNTAFIRDIYLPVSVDTQLPSVPPYKCKPTPIALEGLLHRIFYWPSFRPGQLEALSRTLEGKDSIVLLPTGSGKSAIYHLASLLRPGSALIVSPLLSLMEDQLTNLKAMGIDRAEQLRGDLSPAQAAIRLRRLSEGQLLMCYITPERLQNQRFRDHVRVLGREHQISLLAIDEAHCISEWGHDFRPAYMGLRQAARDHAGDPPVLALTGTASLAVLRDIEQGVSLDDKNGLIVPGSFDRPELQYRVQPCTSGEKGLHLLGSLTAVAEHFGDDMFTDNGGVSQNLGLVFCPHVNGRYGVSEASKIINSHLETNHITTECAIYSGKAPKGENKSQWAAHKRDTAIRFRRGEVGILACTKSFGMGINIPNIRFTIHYGLPPSIEAFYQEAGRAGRDSKDAYCWILLSNDNPEINSELLLSGRPFREFYEQYKSSSRSSSQDDIGRQLYFHTGNFSGPEDDHGDIMEMVGVLHPCHEPGTILVPQSQDESQRNRQEKALYRLGIMGVIRDYGIDAGSRSFTVTRTGFSANQRSIIVDNIKHYLGAYQPAFAKKVGNTLSSVQVSGFIEFVSVAARSLLEFLYGTIEASRRRALAELLRICTESTEADDPELLRKGVLDYLQESRFDQTLNEIAHDPDLGFEAGRVILQSGVTQPDARILVARLGRLLEDYPEHPTLLLLRSAAACLTANPDLDDIRQNASAAARMIIQLGSHDESTYDPLLAMTSTLCGTADTSNSTVVAAIGAFVEGWIMVVPNKRQIAHQLHSQGLFTDMMEQVLMNILLREIQEAQRVRK
jgi:ATP-dependent DNA helicase RecQ